MGKDLPVTKICTICPAIFERPAGMSDAKWSAKKTCGDKTCVAEQRRRNGAKGAKARAVKLTAMGVNPAKAVFISPTDMVPLPPPRYDDAHLNRLAEYRRMMGR